MPVKLLATNPFAPSAAPAVRAYRWTRPLGVLPQRQSPPGRDGPGSPRTHRRPTTRGRPCDTGQLFTITRAASDQLRAATRQTGCDLGRYRISPLGANNSNNNTTSNACPKSKNQLPSIKPAEGSRFEGRLDRRTHGRTEVLQRLHRRRRPREKQPATPGPPRAGAQDFPVINAKETEPRTRQANRVAKTATGSDCGYLIRESSGAQSQDSSPKGRRVGSSVTSSTAIVTKTAPTRRSDSSRYNSRGPDTAEERNPTIGCPRHELDEAGVDNESTKQKPGSVEVAAPLHGDPDASGAGSDDQGWSTGASGPVVSSRVADSVSEELQKIAPRRLEQGPACATAWRQGLDETPASDDTDKDRFDRAMRVLQPRVPHVVWPENKYYSPNTVFVYATPSRLAAVAVPSHSVDCPQCRFYQAWPKGDVCPPNSPTPWMQNEFGFYPVQRHFGSKAEQ